MLIKDRHVRPASSMIIRLYESMAIRSHLEIKLQSPIDTPVVEPGYQGDAVSQRNVHHMRAGHERNTPDATAKHRRTLIKGHLKRPPQDSPAPNNDTKTLLDRHAHGGLVIVEVIICCGP